MGVEGASGISVETDDFTGALGASNTSVQSALESLSASTATVITSCSASDNFCFVLSGGKLLLYVNNELQTQFPE